MFDIAKPYTMTGKEAMYGLYSAVRYVAKRGIPGDFVECGVWRGGSSLLAALTFQEFDTDSARARGFFHSIRKNPRRYWLYDTYEGMTEPSDVDIDLDGNTAKGYVEKYGDEGKWCYASHDDVRSTLVLNGVPENSIVIVKGDVVETLQRLHPKQISVLRLDTDWYESTKCELEVLYPLLSPGGVIIIDDYGHWEGARQAVDEYFCSHNKILLHRITYAVRMGIKI